MISPVKKIGHTVVVFATDHQGITSAAVVIKEGKHIDVHLELILVQMNIAGRDWIWESVEMVTLKHYITVKSHFFAMLFWKILTFEKVEN